MEKIDIKNKVIEIECENGSTIMALEIDEQGQITRFFRANIADFDGDYIFDTDKQLIRIQEEGEF